MSFIFSSWRGPSSDKHPAPNGMEKIQFSKWFGIKNWGFTLIAAVWTWWGLCCMLWGVRTGRGDAFSRLWYWGSDLELGVIYFPTNWGAKELQNLPNHRVVFFGAFQFFVGGILMVDMNEKKVRVVAKMGDGNVTYFPYWYTIYSLIIFSFEDVRFDCSWEQRQQSQVIQ